MFLIISYQITPVSYTHLDVYKRQSSHIAILNICSSPSTHKFDILLSFGWIIFCIFSYFLLYFGIFIQNFNHYSIFVIFHVRLQNYISIPIFNTFCYCTYRFTAIFPITINTAIRTILTYPA